MTDQPGPVQPVLRGASSFIRIPSCSFGAADLRKLADLVEGIAKDAAEREVQQHRKPESQPEEDFQKFLTNLRTALAVWVSVRTPTGEWSGGRPAEVLKDEALPDTIANVTLDSAFDYRAQTGQTPLDYITVNLGFRLRGLLDVSQDAAVEGMKQSNAVVFSSDPTWVAGVQRKLEGFFKERRTLWRWLHGLRTYDLFVTLVGFPLALLWANRIDGWIMGTGLALSEASRVAILVYVVLVLLYLFRLMFNYAVRIFPRYEGPRRGGRPGRGSFIFLMLQVGGWFSTLFLDAIRRLISR